MLDTEIHNGLSEKEVRDFLSEQISKSIIPIMKEHSWPRGQSTWVTALNNARVDLENAQSEITRCEKMIGIRRLLDTMGWDEHDCSDHVSCTGKNWRNFIGTLDEFKKFMKDNFNEDVDD